MKIDIVDFSESQFAVMSMEKLREIRSAQVKKDRMTAELEKRIEEERKKLIDKGVYPSDVLEKIRAELTAEYDREITILREGLIFFLHYAEDEREGYADDVPYLVDFSLSEEQRMFIVKEYYEKTYEDGVVRYDAFKKDTFVRTYLGELYPPLHDYFLMG